jgi:hypothetical protein
LTVEGLSVISYLTIQRDLKNLSLNLSPTRRETLNLPPFPHREAGWFHTSREKLKLAFKASLRFGERFGEGSKAMLQNEKSEFMYFSFFV